MSTSSCCSSCDPAPLHARARLDGVLLTISGLGALLAELLSWTTVQDGSLPVVALALLSIICGGRRTLLHAIAAVRSLSLDIHFLMALAVIGAMAIGHWPEAAMVVFLFEVAERIEEASLARAKNSIGDLMALAPDITRVRAGEDWIEVETGQVIVGQRVLIKPGERVPLDGKIVAGSSELNQAPITGESLPVEKTRGDDVYAGSINGSGALEVLVSRAADNSTLAHIVRLVEQAQADQAPVQRLVDKFAKYYTPTLVLGAILLATLPTLLFAQPFIEWFSRALVLLVISCPCALVISTPVAIWCGLTAAAQRGVVIKGGAVLEHGRELRAIAFDKTGTLTYGKPQVTDIIALNGLNEAEVLHHSASLEAHSDHPLAGAMVEKWKDGNDPQPLLNVTNFQAIAGRGAQGEVQGREYFIGNHRFTHEREACDAHVEEHLSRLEGEGKSTLVFGDSRQSLGVFGVADSIRDESTAALQQLHALGIETILLTGDNSQAAGRIATQTGIKDMRSNLLPEDKLTALNQLRVKYSVVGMVGDGINDAPALAKADIGFVMGAAGSDAALEVADVALMNDDLNKVVTFIRLSRFTTRVLWQNVFCAIAIKALFFILALTGHATLWMAVFADVGTSLLVVFNSLRLLRCR